MNELPDSIQHYLSSLWMEDGKFAYLSFDPQGLIKHWHCHINYYGLTDLQTGDKVTEKLIFLEGLLPYQETEVFILPSVNFANGIAADIHILPAEHDIYVLFFDKTGQVKQQQILQQERYNIDLLYQQQQKNIELLKQTYQELELKKKQAETSNKEKSQLLAYITHDLRTPLTAILGFTQFLDTNMFGELTEKQRDCIVHILDAGNHMNELINDILDAAHLESGNIELYPEALAANRVIAECIAWLEPVAKQQQIKLINRAFSDVKIQIDAKRFKQIMINVLNNAIKYNREQGCIVVACKVLETVLRISIKDTGIGIADDQLERLFQPFTRVLDKERAKEISGHGIGLSECKQLLNLMQGSLSVRSELNVGSVFYIDLPLVMAVENKEPKKPQHVVYYYQDKLHFDLLNNLLSDPHQLTGCDQLGQIIQLCSQYPSILLIDIDAHQPSVDIKKLHYLKEHVKLQTIIAIFAKQTPASIIQQTLAQSFADDYLTRPFDFNQLADIFA